MPCTCVDSKQRRFAALGGALLIVLILQAAGLLDGLNGYVNAHIPMSEGLLVNAVTNTVWFAVLGTLILFLWEDRRAGRKIGAFTATYVLSVILALITVGILKAAMGTMRPTEFVVSAVLFEGIEDVNYYSFPSGHTVRASVIAYALSEKYPKYWPLWWAYAVLIGLTRLLLHMHWFSDVLFSMMLGPWVFMAVEYGLERRKR